MIVMNMKIDPVEVGLRHNFTQGHGNVTESGNYYRPTDAVAHQYGWINKRAHTPSVIFPRHMTSVPGNDTLLRPSPGPAQKYAHYATDAEPDSGSGLFAQFISFIKDILDKILKLFHLDRAYRTPDAEKLPSSVEPSNETTTQQSYADYSPNYTNNITNMANAQMGNTTIFSRTISA